MNNQYIDMVKSKLIEQGFDTSELDNIAAGIINYATQNKINVIKLLEDGLDFDQLDSTSVTLLNTLREPTSFITKRFQDKTSSKFVRRSIIE